LGRTLFYELSKLGGVPGWILSAVIAASTTIALGYAASIWFEKGEQLSTQTVANISKQITQILLQSFRSKDKNLPNKKNLRDRLQDQMEKLPYGQNRQLLDQAAKEDPVDPPEIDLE
jgi:hypothetical protein